MGEPNRPTPWWLLCILATSLLNGRDLGAQTGNARAFDSLRLQVDSLREAQRDLVRELRDIRALIERALFSGHSDSTLGSAPLLVIDTSSSPAKGADTAPITLVEFADYHCVYCGNFVVQTLPLLEAEYISTGRVRFVFRDFPFLSQLQSAQAPAEAAHCAGEQGRFWEMHDLLFSNQSQLRTDTLTAYARRLRLKIPEFRACISQHRHGAAIRRGLDDGEALGVRGTPAFFIGWAEPGASQLKVIRTIYGAQSYGVFKRAIDDALRRKAGK